MMHKVLRNYEEKIILVQLLVSLYSIPDNAV